MRASRKQQLEAKRQQLLERSLLIRGELDAQLDALEKHRHEVQDLKGHPPHRHLQDQQGQHQEEEHYALESQLDREFRGKILRHWLTTAGQIQHWRRRATLAEQQLAEVGRLELAEKMKRIQFTFPYVLSDEAVAGQAESMQRSSGATLRKSYVEKVLEPVKSEEFALQLEDSAHQLQLGPSPPSQGPLLLDEQGTSLMTSAGGGSRVHPSASSRSTSSSSSFKLISPEESLNLLANDDRHGAQQNSQLFLLLKKAKQAVLESVNAELCSSGSAQETVERLQTTASKLIKQIEHMRLLLDLRRQQSAANAAYLQQLKSEVFDRPELEKRAALVLQMEGSLRKILEKTFTVLHELAAKAVGAQLGGGSRGGSLVVEGVEGSGSSVSALARRSLAQRFAERNFTPNTLTHAATEKVLQDIDMMADVLTTIVDPPKSTVAGAAAAPISFSTKTNYMMSNADGPPAPSRKDGKGSGFAAFTYDMLQR